MRLPGEAHRWSECTIVRLVPALAFVIHIELVRRPTKKTGLKQISVPGDSEKVGNAVLQHEILIECVPWRAGVFPAKAVIEGKGGLDSPAVRAINAEFILAPLIKLGSVGGESAGCRRKENVSSEGANTSCE